MSETSTPPTGQASSPRDPGGLLLELIITLLTPMFLAIAGGNLTHARAAATETLVSYRAQTQHDLIAIAKIIAFGLATISSLSRSMEDDLTLNQILRLRANANATDRSEHRNRQALEKTHAREAAGPPLAPVIDTAPAPQLPQAAKTDAQMQYAATWAASAALVAAETAASLDSLPEDERHGAAIWVDVLNDLAKDFTQNGVPPRPKPGDLGALFSGA